VNFIFLFNYFNKLVEEEEGWKTVERDVFGRGGKKGGWGKNLEGMGGKGARN
jgi:hypothetical protein